MSYYWQVLTEERHHVLFNQQTMLQHTNITLGIFTDLITMAFFYHWQELPRVFCRDKTGLLLRQKYACRNESFVATKLCLSRQNIFVLTKLLSQQIFVATNIIFS